jgi:hypothetical protein
MPFPHTELRSSGLLAILGKFPASSRANGSSIGCSFRNPKPHWPAKQFPLHHGWPGGTLLFHETALPNRAERPSSWQRFSTRADFAGDVGLCASLTEYARPLFSVQHVCIPMLLHRRDSHTVEQCFMPLDQPSKRLRRIESCTCQGAKCWENARELQWIYKQPSVLSPRLNVSPSAAGKRTRAVWGKHFPGPCSTSTWGGDGDADGDGGRSFTLRGQFASIPRRLQLNVS